MKKLTSILFSAVLTCLVFTAVLYSSCSKSSGLSCEKLICQNGGTCRDGKCVCPTGYEGQTCEKHDPCKLMTCQHNGTCTDGKCICQEGFSGQFCEINACTSMNCGHGTCRNGKCNCELGYEGQFCQIEKRERFLGTWKGTFTTCDSPDQVTITITRNSSYGQRVLVNYKSTYDSFKLYYVTAEENTIASEMQDVANTVFSMTIDGNTARYFFILKHTHPYKRECHGTLIKQ